MTSTIGGTIVLSLRLGFGLELVDISTGFPWNSEEPSSKEDDM